MVAARQRERLHALTEEIAGLGGEAASTVLDLRDRA
jgi:NADP-dependent 3-hydroxy acid dehydrogenase YdfG